MFSAILILLVMPFTDLSRSRGTQFKPLSKAAFFIFVGNFLILMELGAKHVESPFIEFGQICTVIYFSHFLIIVPLISLLENTLIDITSKDIILNYGEYATVNSKPWWLWWYVKHDPYVEKKDAYNPLNEGWDGTYVPKGKDFKAHFKGKVLGGLNSKQWVKKNMGKNPPETLIPDPGSNQNHQCGYEPIAKRFVRDDGKIHDPATYQNRIPYNWKSHEQYLKDKNITQEQFDKILGTDPETKKEMQEAYEMYNKLYMEGDISPDTPYPEYQSEDELMSSDGDCDYSNEPKGPVRTIRSGGRRKNVPYGDPVDDKDRMPRIPVIKRKKHSKDDDSSDSDGDDNGPTPKRPKTEINVSDYEPGTSVSDNSKSKISIALNPIILILLFVSIATVVLFNLYPHIKTLYPCIKTLYPHIKTLYQHIEAIVLFLYRNTRPSTASSLYLDAPRPWGIYFQDSATPQMEGLVELHDNILFYLVIILFGVGWLLISIVKNYTQAPISHKYLSHGTLIELIWTITPALILILIAFPSFKLLYLMDEVSDPAMAVLAEGHQWYWSYQYPDFLNNDDEFIEFDSYLIPESDLEDGALRMLEVDNRLIIPELTHVRFIVTGADVIHSLACPALGIKCDAYPGRLNQVSVMINREGTFYGLRP